MSNVVLVETLPPAMRLALAYAPTRARPAYAALFALDCHLAALVRGTHEALLGQIRLAWWRDRLGEDSASWPAGEPILKALASWGGGQGRLARVVDGWEELIGDAPLDLGALSRHAEGRADGFKMLGVAFGERGEPEVIRAAKDWALADLASHLGSAEERTAAQQLLADRDHAAVRLPRFFRPLAVLRVIALRQNAGALGTFAVAVRTGLLGR